MNSPFKFLDAYQKDDFERFFGREKETAQLYNAVFASNLTLVYGASGTGKTSLVNCGLGNKFYDTDWLPIFIRRESNINSSLRKAIHNKQDNKSVGLDAPIRKKIKQLYLDHYKPVYLIFDQFEELFILPKGQAAKTEQEEFYKTIANILQAGLQAKIIIIIREEWIAFLNEFEKVVPSLFDNRLRIEKMNDKNIYRVISGTCKYEKIEVAQPSKTILQIIDNLKDQRKERIDLTNLQVYLDRLWRTDVERQQLKPNQKAEKITFDPALVKEVGKMENVLSDFLDEQLKLIEEKLNARGIENSKGLPLEILFTLVTEDGTKQALDANDIVDNLPKNRKISTTDLEFCMEEFKKIKILRAIEADK
jgi:hypothetical protein